jgi:ABC-type Zn uptake system ZnuABC Zn-binding protein ZnuA
MKISQQLIANILKVVLTIATFAFLYSMTGCSSTHYRNKTKEKTQKVTTNKPQYAFHNNQIIIFENN